MKRFLIFAVIAISLFNCSASQRAQRHLSKAIDHIDKAKKLDPSISITRVDTVEKVVVRPESRVDSIFTSIPGDTVVIENERVKIKYVKLKGDTVYVEGVAKADTVIVKVPCESDILIKRENYKDIVRRVLGLNNLEFYLLHIFLGIFLLVFIYVKWLRPKII
jgi:hypothetical protein